MSNESAPELTSWKEIAQRLQVSVRTAQLWEKERGLPVRRVPGKRGRVYLLEEDLAAWMGVNATGEDLPPVGPPVDGEAPSPTTEATVGGSDTFSGSARPHAPSKPNPTGTAAGSSTAAVSKERLAVPLPRPVVRTLLHPPRAFTLLVALAALTMVIVWATTTVPPETGEPAIWRIEPDTLVVSNRMGHPLFRKYFPEGLREKPYEAGENFEPRLEDLDGDGVNEVIFAAFTEHDENAQRLIVYDAYGNELWQHRPGLLVSTAREAFDDIYTIADVHVLPNPDGTRDVLVSAHHRIFYPNVLTRLSADGEVLARYWHPGQLAAGANRLELVDMNNDGRSEILISGVNNARGAGTLILLDPDDMDGAAWEEDVDYRFQQLPVARELARIFFPRSSLTPPEDRYTIGATIVPGRSTVTVSVQQMIGDGEARVLYTFGPGLELLNVAAGDAFIGRFQRARLTGQVGHSLEDELTALETLVYAEPPHRARYDLEPAGPGSPD